MSELCRARTNHINLRWQLLASASIATILSCAPVTSKAAADDEHPTVWIELGSQWASLSADEKKFEPSFLVLTPRPAPETISPLSVGHLPRSSFDAEGKITLQPSESDWTFTIGVRYGRSYARQHLKQKSAYPTQPLNKTEITKLGSGVSPKYRNVVQFMDIDQQSWQSHAVADFRVGKDVGLGMFGGHASSVMGFGIRFAQFSSRTNATFRSDPDAHPTYLSLYGIKIPIGGVYHSNVASGDIRRSFRGIGPSLSWNASAPVIGHSENGEVTFDWGANAAVLFGRQKTRLQHQTKERYHVGSYSSTNRPVTIFQSSPPARTRSRTVVSPNIGGFAGLTYRLQNFKLSAGYRADFFFGALDGGVNAHSSEMIGFYGPFATVSFGIGG